MSLVSVPHKCTLISHSRSSKKVDNIHIVLVLSILFLILLFSLVLPCHLSLLLSLYYLLLTFPVSSLNVSSLRRVTFFSKFSSSSSISDIFVTWSSFTKMRPLFLLYVPKALFQIPIFHLLKFSLLLQILTPSFLFVLILILALLFLIFASLFLNSSSSIVFIFKLFGFTGKTNLLQMIYNCQQVILLLPTSKVLVFVIIFGPCHANFSLFL